MNRNLSENCLIFKVGKINHKPSMFSLNLRGKLHVFERPLVMGIVNATPDSFYKESRISAADDVLNIVNRMVSEGVDIIDIGGQSTRPGSERVGPDAELSRVLPLIQSVRKSYPELILSIDTYHSFVALSAVQAGADIVNDISGGEMDPDMLGVVGRIGVPYVCTHMQGTPETMQVSPSYEDVVSEVMAFFRKKASACASAGINDLILDPGFGFGKGLLHNYRLLSALDVIRSIGYPLLAGVSRKSMIRQVLGVSTEDALNGTTVLHTIALMKGANIIRVHDVREAVEVIKLMEACRNL
jgi:dihydropteroate synthase